MCRDRVPVHYVHETKTKESNYLVLSAVTEGKLGSSASRGQPHELVPHADAEDGLDVPPLQLDHLLQLLHRLHAHSRVSRPIGQEYPVVLLRTRAEKAKGCTGLTRHTT